MNIKCQGRSVSKQCLCMWMVRITTTHKTQITCDIGGASVGWKDRWSRLLSFFERLDIEERLGIRTYLAISA
jgi:hypothetical protein